MFVSVWEGKEDRVTQRQEDKLYLSYIIHILHEFNLKEEFVIVSSPTSSEFVFCLSYYLLHKMIISVINTDFILLLLVHYLHL